MYRTMRGLTLALVMLLGALSLTGLLASSLQQRAEESQSIPGGYSPAYGATVDSSGWPIEGARDDTLANDAGTGRSRSRLSSVPVDPGA
jgi:hypothetical protein